MKDLNAQAIEWATVWMANRPRGKGGLLLAVDFEHEKTVLIKIPDGLPYPYIVHERSVDQYEFVTFAAYCYWISAHVHNGVKVLEYAHEIKIFDGRKELACYPLPAEGVRNQIFPEDRPHIPYQPRRRSEGPTNEEENFFMCHFARDRRISEISAGRQRAGKTPHHPRSFRRTEKAFARFVFTRYRASRSV